MATIHLEILIDTSPEAAWDALRDWEALDTRLAPGFVTKVRVDGRVRAVTFFNGTEVNERIIDVDDIGRRLAWTIEDGPYAHHSGSAQVFPAGASGTRFVWITDLLPDEMAEPTTAMMRKGLATIKETLETAG